MRRTVLICFLIGFVSINFLLAQNVRIYTNGNNITTDDNLVLTVELSTSGGRLPRPNFPQIKGFMQTGTSTQQSMGPSGVSISFSQTYVTQTPGTFTIPRFTYELNGQTYAFGPQKVNVKKGTGKRRNQNGNRGNNPFADFFKDPFDDFFRDPFGGSSTNPQDLEFRETNADYFMSFNLNKNKCYLGEQLIGEVVLYINQRDAGKVNVDGNAILEMQQRIKNTGFWQEIFDFKEVPMKPVNIEGKPYYAYTLYRTYLFPLKTGKIVFDDLYLDAKKLFVATNASIRQKIMRQNTKFEPIRIRAPKRELLVRELPPTQLPNASMVGKFSMDGSITAKEVNTGDVVEIKLNVKGNGNMAMCPNPTTAFPKEFQVDEPTTNLRTQANKVRYAGEKDFTYYLVPTRNGDFDLGPIQFYYFNPESETYDSLSVESIPLRVNGEDLENLVLKQKGNDGFYQAAFASADNGLERDSGGYWMSFLGGFLLVAGVLTFRIVKSRQKEAPVVEAPKSKLD